MKQAASPERYSPSALLPAFAYDVQGKVTSTFPSSLKFDLLL